MKSSCRIGVIIIILLMNLAVDGQDVPDTTITYKIETKDGNIFTGNIVSQDSATLVLKTEVLGEVRIPRAEIKSRTELRAVNVVNNQIWLPNPQSGRYFWAPNGYGLAKESSYYQNIWVLYNQFSFSVSENFTMGAGIMPLFLFAGAVTPVWVVPKISIPVVADKANIGVGAFLGTILGEDTETFGLLYETTTFGSRDKNFSIGFAYGFAAGEWMARPILNFSTMIRTGPRGYFISENYLIPYETETWDNYDSYSVKNSYAAIISLGGRSIIRKIGLDYSLWIPINADLDTFLAVPFLGVTIPIGKK